MKIYICRLISCICWLLSLLAFADYLALTRGFSSSITLPSNRREKSIKNIPIKKLFILSLSVFIAAESMSQHNEQLILKPICKIDITTVNGNMLKGLLLLTYDSIVIVYPGKRREWNRKKEYRLAVYSCSKIKKIIIKKNARILKSVSLGAAVGALPLFAGLNKTEKDAIARVSAITVPAGMIVGALLGFSAQKKFQINASDSLFSEFQKQIQ